MAERVSGSSLEALSGATANERISGAALEALSGATANERVSGSALEALSGATAHFRISGVALEVLSDPFPPVTVKHGQPPRTRTIGLLLARQRQQLRIKRLRWPHLLQKLTGVPPAGGTGQGTIPDPTPTPTPTFTSGIRQDLWLKVTPGTVYRISVLKSRIHDSED